MDDKTIPSSTVTFDVGGKTFKVSRSLIEKSEMLSRLVSDLWTNGDSKTTIFIDRSGDLFYHVIEFLRYGSIELPLSVPRSMFNRELDYYGISVDDNLVEQNSVLQELKRVKEALGEAELKHDMFTIAIYCFNQYTKGITTCSLNLNSDIGLKRNPSHYPLRKAMEVLSRYLKEYYGLEAHSEQFSHYGLTLELNEVGQIIVENATAAESTDEASEDYSDEPAPSFTRYRRSGSVDY